MAHKNIFTITALATALALVGCGGGGSEGYYNNGSNNGGGTTPTTQEKYAELLSIGQSKASLNAGGADSLTLTIRTLDSKGGIIANADLNIEILDAKAAGANLSTATKLTSDENGLITTTISLANSNLSQRFNRSITLIVTSGQAKEEITIPVSGTALSISSDVNLLEEGSNANIILRAVDAVGSPLSGVNASLTDVLGNTISGTNTQVTDSAGQTVFSIPYNTVLNSSGQKLELMGKISVESNQVSSNLLTNGSITLTANVSNNVLQQVTNSDGVNIDEAKTITVKVNATTQAELAGKQVAFETTNGEVAPKLATIQNIRQENGKWVGEASTSHTGKIASIATISAQFGNNTIYIAQKINSGVPKFITLQSESSVLSPGSNTKVIALVKDENNSPVPNATVNFKIVKDTSSTGRISQPTATTDSAGRATVIYTAGSASTLGGEVEITAFSGNATTPKPIYSENLLLTVANQSAFITLAHNHEIIKESGDNTHYYKEFSASVVDSAGNPIRNQLVSISMDLTHFYKGRFVWTRDYSYAQDSDGLWGWLGTLGWYRQYTIYENRVAKEVTTFIECPSNEFPNPVSILKTDNTEAKNGEFRTDNQGKFDFKVRYGRNYSNWLRVNLNASTTVSTKDSLTALSFMPPVAAEDVDNQNGNWRPDRESPYGTDYSTCLTYNK